MIAVDTSALMAILLGEGQADACIAALERQGDIVISGGTLTEALIVARRKGLADAMIFLIDRLELTVIDVTPVEARRAAAAYDRWGRGNHPAGLNFGDCFAYAAAQRHNCPLLFVGNDFSQTDITPAIAR